MDTESPGHGSAPQEAVGPPLVSLPGDEDVVILRGRIYLNILKILEHVIGIVVVSLKYFITEDENMFW